MPGYYTQRERARALRSNTTDAEQRLWRYLRRRQLLDIQFYRQRPLGCFIADFWAPALKLVVELDGGQHFKAAGLASDARRDEWMREQGIRVVRFDNRQVLCETEQVLEALLGVMKERLAASLPPSPATLRFASPFACEGGSRGMRAAKRRVITRSRWQRSGRAAAGAAARHRVRPRDCSAGSRNRSRSGGLARGWRERGIDC